jgi:hypothetical protein
MSVYRNWLHVYLCDKNVHIFFCKVYNYNLYLEYKLVLLFHFEIRVIYKMSRYKANDLAYMFEHIYFLI